MQCDSIQGESFSVTLPKKDKETEILRLEVREASDEGNDPEQSGQEVWQGGGEMNKQTRHGFLVALRAMWEANAEMNYPLTVDDLLDDAASLGVEGASEMYAVYLVDELERKSKVHDLDPTTGDLPPLTK